MSILVRWATRWDRKPLTEMIAELARQHGVLASTETVSAAFDYVLSHPDHARVAVAQREEDKELLGTASLHQAYSTWNAAPYGTIEDFFVLPDLRGTGVGTAILELLVGEARRRGYCRVELQVRDTNERARRFYESRGLSFTGYLVYATDLGEATDRPDEDAPDS